MSEFRLKILLSDKKIFEDDAISVTVSCENRLITVLSGHAPMTAMLVEGSIVVKTQKEEMEGIAGAGVLQVDRDGAAILVHSFQWAGDETAEDNVEETTGDGLL